MRTIHSNRYLMHIMIHNVVHACRADAEQLRRVEKKLLLAEGTTGGGGATRIGGGGLSATLPPRLPHLEMSTALQTLKVRCIVGESLHKFKVHAYCDEDGCRCVVVVVVFISTQIWCPLQTG